ncbi:peptidyl-prolyl cis-trans isomerase [Eudoraea chungangensis]|uniref:peptidyl-prolyl cis-trans isomerase n=1 Tax=Eudoraea chungangensis TaxID=1481905 RepID=UPI0023EDECFC|nr:peptidyl-prolyl cis-trans isomerase [Eudoraea chungangensis]
MLFFKDILYKNSKRISLCAIACLVVACEAYINRNAGDEPLARVGDAYLYWDEVALSLADNLKGVDSASLVTNYINQWATRQILLEKAKINLSEEKLAQFEQMVSEYRTDLYTRAYKEALVNQVNDTLISEEELRSFYETEKANFKLKEKIVRLRFIQLPLQFLNKPEVTESLKRFEKTDFVYLDSIGVQFKKLNFNDSLWVPATRVIEEIPPLTTQNEAQYLKNSQFFELEDAMGVYLTKVVEVLEANEIAPFTYVKSSISQVLLNRRKLDYIRKLETEIIDEATQKNEFEVYTIEN